MIKKLNELKENEIGKIISVDLEEDKQIRFIHLGLVKDAKIKYKFKSFLNSPLAYQINGCVFSLRLEDAKKIEVEVC